MSWRHMGRAGVLGLAALVLTATPLDLKPVNQPGYRSVLASERGKVVLVDFWATWCGPCREEMPALAALQKKWQGKRFALVTISADQPESRKAAVDFLDANGVQPPAYLLQVPDQDAFVASVSPKWSGALPALFLYDASGHLSRSFLGETKPATIEQAIERLLKG